MTSPFTDEGLRQIADSKCALNNILVPHSMLIALADQLLEARRDAGRYRWLRNHALDVQWQGKDGYVYHDLRYERESEQLALDAAIDAAMREGK